MRVVSADDISRALTFPDLVAALRRAFAAGVVTPVRHHHPIARAGEESAMLLLMPAWTDMSARLGDDAAMGVKIVSVVPGNAGRALPSVIGAYVLFSGLTGEPQAVLDGTRLTLWRTAAASALAATYLARQDARRLVLVGAGALAPYLARAHAAVRPIREVTVWNRSAEKASALADDLAPAFERVTVANDLAAAVAQADIVSCATMSTAQLVRGSWLSPGSHLDLVGAYTPAMRESDDDAVRRARLFVDTRAGALKEAGDIVDPLRRGVIAEQDIVADLTQLARGEARGRGSPEEITLFKSVGTALEDLAAAQLVVARLAA